MPITYRIVADTADELPEALRKVAKPDASGKLVVDSLPEGYGIEDVGGLKKAVGAERSVSKVMRDRLAEFGWKLSEDGTKWTEEGIKAEMARQALDAVKSGAIKNNKELEDYKAEMQRIAAEREKAIATERDSLRSELQQTLLDQAALAAIVKANGNPALLMPVVKERAKVEKSADGRHRVVIYDENGRQRFSTKATANGAVLDLNEWMEELRGSQDYRQAFKASATGGSGAPSQTGGSGRVANPGQTQLSSRELFDRANAPSPS